MFASKRPDGQRVVRAPNVRLFMPLFMLRRNESAVYFEQDIDVTEVDAYLKRWNAGDRPRLREIHLFLAAAARVLHDRPRLNRFIAGRRLYQREHIDISISVLKAKKDDAQLTVVKQRFDGTVGLVETRARTEEILRTGRGQEQTHSEREMALLSYLPRWIVPLLVKLQRFAEYINIFPRSLVDNDPLYASLMISHLGTIGINAAYHHLYEHGTIPIFVTIGKRRMKPVVMADGSIEARPIVTARYAFDERIADGFYAARAIDLVQKFMENPWLLEVEADNGPGGPNQSAIERRSSVSASGA
ncbi:MAG: hypothetical protein CR993_09260 [Rhodobacterales bacterium]|nr:MAG: hypothetical protein CR993_09260 [Rhodobacterales bacterium]